MTRDDENSASTHRLQKLPPQILVLMLETGAVLFLFVRERIDGSLEFVTSQYQNRERFQYLGYNLTVDPSSRYMAASSVEGAFTVYELESLETLSSRYLRDGSFNPIIRIRRRKIRGVLYQLHFLHPRPEDDYHIILLMIICQPATLFGSRMVLYDWELGDDLETVFQQENRGITIREDYELPHLIVPLKFNGAFIAITTGAIGIAGGILQGGLPEFQSLGTVAPNQPEPGNNVTKPPVWVAWARPFRRKTYFEKNDVIYLAREDGIINFVEIDEASLTPSVHNVGTINTTISSATAFTTAYDRWADILITGGDSGPGGIWKLPARSNITQVGTIPNWTAVWDMAITDEYSSWTAESPTNNVSSMRISISDRLRTPDHIFCISGRGPNSTLTELRSGVEARIGLEFDFGRVVRQSWMFPVNVGNERGYYALLSLPDSSEVFHISGDLESADALVPDTSPFDMTSRTICAVQSEQGTIIQVTERFTTFIFGSQSSRHYHEDLLEQGEIVVGAASCTDGFVALCVYKEQATQIHVLRTDQMSVSRVTTWDVQGEVTCLSIFTVSNQTLFAMGTVVGGIPHFLLHTLDGVSLINKSLGGHNDSTELYGRMEALTSVSVLADDAEALCFVLGTRSGHLVTSRVRQEHCDITLTVERLGMGPIHVFSAPAALASSCPTVFACCDNILNILTNFSESDVKFKSKSAVWPTDSNNASMPTPQIHSAFCLEQNLYGYHGHMSLMMLAGSRILLADVRPHPRPVPRTISLDGTPSRVIFSKTWNCLIVAHLKEDRTTLSFVDPRSGAIISRPSDRTDERPTDYISGLGVENGKVWSLSEWLYVKDGKTFPFIIVGTESEVLIVSIKREDNQAQDGSTTKLRYFTRYRKKAPKGPVSSVVGSAEDLLICSGDSLFWEVLDVTEKRFKFMKQFQLDSEVVSLKVDNGKACVLTARHSLQVLDLHVESNTTDISLIHSDHVTRRLCDMIELGPSTEPPGKWPVRLLSSQLGDIVGLWVPWGQRNKELELVFEGALARAVRKLGRGRTRPLWLGVDRERRYNTLSNTVDDAEIYGVGLNGSLQHFSLIGPDLWRFLRLIQNLAEHCAEVCPFKKGVRSLTGSDVYMDIDAELEPRLTGHMMHINGDILERCLERRALAMLLRIPDAIDLFCEYLDGIEDGVHTLGFRDDEDEGRGRYIQLGYDILEYLFEPVL
ncbi:mono-functional DNA-alkylating methyl methanesulfonate N-term-domain-containing protein [Mariannaea sp. PMI_226]|nr:mono-functional DNA-alkylating methyl methanesulfonate N-term-domain-containing protein [Mariannaea sp. PMI_226]